MKSQGYSCVQWPLSPSSVWKIASADECLEERWEVFQPDKSNTLTGSCCKQALIPTTVKDCEGDSSTTTRNGKQTMIASQRSLD